jgi:hypothetical protein
VSEKDILASRSRRRLPRFGDVVEHPLKGRGVIYALVPKDHSLLIAFEEGCVCCGYQNLTYVGSIYELGALYNETKT